MKKGKEEIMKCYRKFQEISETIKLVKEVGVCTCTHTHTCLRAGTGKD